MTNIILDTIVYFVCAILILPLLLIDRTAAVIPILAAVVWRVVFSARVDEITGEEL